MILFIFLGEILAIFRGVQGLFMASCLGITSVSALWTLGVLEIQLWLNVVQIAFFSH